MSKRLIGYVVLGSCDELVAWQKENKDYDLISIMPMVSGLKMQFDNPVNGDFADAEGKTGIGAFVTFAFAETKKEG